MDQTKIQTEDAEFEIAEEQKDVKQQVKDKVEEAHQIEKEDKELQTEQKEGKASAELSRAKATASRILNQEKSENLLAAIGYLPPLFLLSLTMKKDSDFCQFHGKQALGIFVVIMALKVPGWLFFSGFVPGGFMWFFSFLIRFLIVGVSGLGFYMAIRGQRFEIPYLSKLTKYFDFR